MDGRKNLERLLLAEEIEKNKPKKFLLQWSESVRFNCSVYIEAASEEEAIEKWNDGTYGDYDRDELNNKFSDLESISEESD